MIAYAQVHTATKDAPLPFSKRIRGSIAYTIGVQAIQSASCFSFTIKTRERIDLVTTLIDLSPTELSLRIDYVSLDSMVLDIFFSLPPLCLFVLSPLCSSTYTFSLFTYISSMYYVLSPLLGHIANFLVSEHIYTLKYH